MNAECFDDARGRAWYVATFALPFTRWRAGRCLMSLRWRGFRLFTQPVDIIDYGHSEEYFPWEVWQVRPLRIIGYEPELLAHETGRRLRVRSMQVVQRMPAGFEFGSNGAAVRQLVEDLAEGQLVADVSQPDPPIGPDRNVGARYAAAMIHLRDQTGDLDRADRDRVVLAREYLELLSRRRRLREGNDGRWRLHPQVPLYDLLGAAACGVAIPPVVRHRWSLTQAGVCPSTVLVGADRRSAAEHDR